MRNDLRIVHNASRALRRPPACGDRCETHSDEEHEKISELMCVAYPSLHRGSIGRAPWVHRYLILAVAFLRGIRYRVVEGRRHRQTLKGRSVYEHLRAGNVYEHDAPHWMPLARIIEHYGAIVAPNDLIKWLSEPVAGEPTSPPPAPASSFLRPIEPI